MSACENPNIDKDALMTRRQKFDGKTKICVKCKENTGNIVIRYAVYCKTCFFPLIQARFRKSLEPAINAVPDGPRRKALKAAGSLVIGFSGGTGSTAMLDLIAKAYFASRGTGEEALKGGKEHPRNVDKGVWKGKPAVCYVEVCGAFPGEKDRTEEICAVVHSYPDAPFEFIPLRLEDCFDPRWWDKVGGGGLPASAQSLGLDMTDEDLHLSQASSSFDTFSLNLLRAYLSSLPTQTAFYSAIQILTRLLLLHTAAARNASHLLLGTSLTSLSVNLISGIAKGSGFAVAEEAKEEWCPRPKRGMMVRIVRPMRDIGMKECAIWDWFCGLRVVGRSSQLYAGGKNAIGALTRDFIFGLESDYPATVSTIARTCAKLAPKEGSDGICVLCERPAQHGIQTWKARIAIRSYQEASSAVSGKTRPPHLTEEEISDLTKPSSTSITTSSSLTPHLCYACHTLLTSRSSRGTAAPLPPGQTARNIPLPMWVMAAVSSPTPHRDGLNEDTARADDEGMHSVKMTRADMKSHIGEFLFPDE